MYSELTLFSKPSLSYMFLFVIPCILHEAATRNEPRHEKTNVLVSDIVRHKPGCTITEDG